MQGLIRQIGAARITLAAEASYCGRVGSVEEAQNSSADSAMEYRAARQVASAVSRTQTTRAVRLRPDDPMGGYSPRLASGPHVFSRA